jgi:hypothetical protein
MKCQYNFLIPTLIVAVISLAAAPIADPEYSLTISAGSGRFKRGADIKVRIVLANLTDHQISIGRLNDSFGPEFEYTINVRDADSRAVALTRYGRASHGTPDAGDVRQGCGDCSGFSEDLAPHEKITDEISVSKIHDLSKPGKYTIQVSRFNDDGLKTLVKSNTLTITIAD